MKRFLLSIILAVLFVVSPASAEFFSDVIVTSPNGIWTDSRAYLTLQAAITAVGANNREIVVAKKEVCINLTIPSNVQLKFIRGGSIANSGQLNINTKNVSAGDYQIFTGTGDIDFHVGSTVRSAWFSNAAEAINVTNDDSLTLVISKHTAVASNCTVGNDVTLKWEAMNHLLVANPGITISNIKNIEAGNYQLFGGAGDFDFLDGTQLNLAWFLRLRLVVTWVENERVTLVVSEPNTVSYDNNIPSNIDLDIRMGGILSIDAGRTLTINGSLKAIGWPFTGAGTVAFAAGTGKSNLFAATNLIADVFANISGAAGATPNDCGLQFINVNNAGTKKVYAAIIGEVESDIAGSERGRLHFLLNDLDYSQVVGTVNADGSLIWGPGLPSFKMEIAGDQTGPGPLVPTAALFGERVSAVDPDYEDARIIAVRNLKAANVANKAGIAFSCLNTGEKETKTAIIRAGLTTITEGSEIAQFYFTLKRGVYQDRGPTVKSDDDGVSGITQAINQMYQYKTKVLRKTANYSLAKEDSHVLITNTGAKGVIEFICPNIAACGYGYKARFQQGFTDLTVTTDYKWTLSGGGANEYYCELVGGGDPGLGDPESLYYIGMLRTEGVVGALNNWEWDYGDGDALGFNTVYVRWGGADPDALTESLFITYKYRVASFSIANHGLYWTGLTNNTHTVESDGVMGTGLELESMDIANIWTGISAGIWTRIN